jgi:hypothetical protein
MSWRIITEADVVTQITGVELDSYREVVLADGQADPVQPFIDGVTATVRGFVTANSKNDLDADTAKIPDRLIDAAVALIVVKIISRAGQEPSDTRKTLASDANRLLRDVASGKFSIEDSVTGVESTGGGVSVVNQRTPRVTRDNMKGL